MRIVDEDRSSPVPQSADPISLVERLLAEQDQVINQLDDLDLQIQQVIAAHTAQAVARPADAA